MIAYNILIFPDYLFFNKIIDIPKSLSQKEARSFIANELEVSSPMPLSGLRWGYLRQNGKSLIMASTPERIADAGYTHTEIENAHYAIPSVAVISSVKLPNGWNFYETSDSITAIYSLDGVYEKIFSIKKTIADIHDQFSELAKICGTKEYLLFKLKEFKKLSFGKYKVVLEEANGQELKSTFSSKSYFDTFDIRNFAQIKVQKTKRIKKNLALFFLKAIPFAILLLLIFGVYLHFKSNSLDEKTAHINELLPESKKIEGLGEQVISLRNFSGKTMFNTLMIAKVNASRPSSVEFLRTYAAVNELEITGSAKGLAELNAYAQTLRENPEIKGVEVDTLSKSGEAKFTLKIKFKE